MKRVISFTGLAFLFCFLSSFAFADTSLADNMKQIGALFKDISKSVSDSSQNQKCAAEANQLIALFSVVQNQVPDSISSLPADQQATALGEFKGLIQQEIDSSRALEKALLNNDNASAAAIVQQMAETKKEGHGQFAN